MTYFGTSAYLRILLQNLKPMETSIKLRASKEKKNARDYHASLRLAVNKYIKNPSLIDEIILDFENIKNKSERESAKKGFTATVKFLSLNGGNAYQPAERKFESSSGLFGVKFQPNFGIEKNGNRIAVHLWNTKSTITQRAIKAVLGLFLHTFDKNEQPAILCLQTNRLHIADRTQETQKLALQFSYRIDAIFEKYSDLEDSSSKGSSAG